MLRIKNKIPKTAVELFEILPEGMRCQVIENVLYMSPAPLFDHQEILMNISSQLFLFTQKYKLGKTVVAPVDVYLDNKNAFQPDIIFIASNKLSIVKEGKVKGAPDLIVEVLSPGTANDDKGKKKKVYEACGVKEYFIVDPVSGEVISLYGKNNKFEEGMPQKGKIVSRMLKKTFKF